MKNRLRVFLGGPSKRTDFLLKMCGPQLQVKISHPGYDKISVDFRMKPLKLRTSQNFEVTRNWKEILRF